DHQSVRLHRQVPDASDAEWHHFGTRSAALPPLSNARHPTAGARWSSAVKRPELQSVRGAVALLLALVQTAAAQTTPAQTVPAPDATSASRPQSSAAPSALELSGSLGPTLTFGEAANPEYTRSVGRVGVLLGAVVAYRSSYFVAPRFEVGYAALAHGESELPSGPWGDGGKLEQRLRTWVIS